MRNNDFAQFSVDETKVKKASEIKQPLVTHGSVISFNIHACAKCYNEKSVVWFTLISSLFCRVGPKFLQSWLPWSSQCQIQISSALCCCLLRNNYLHQKTTCNQKSNMGEISLFSFVLSFFFWIYWFGNWKFTMQSQLFCSRI